MVAVNTIYHRQYVKSHCVAPQYRPPALSNQQIYRKTSQRIKGGGEGERDEGKSVRFEWPRTSSRLVLQRDHEKSWMFISSFNRIHLKITFHQIAGWRKLTLFPSNLSSPGQRNIFMSEIRHWCYGSSVVPTPIPGLTWGLFNTGQLNHSGDENISLEKRKYLSCWGRELFPAQLVSLGKRQPTTKPEGDATL